MAKSEVRVEMAVRWWMCVPEPDLVAKSDSVVESSLSLHCTGCVNVLAVVLSVYGP